MDSGVKSKRFGAVPRPIKAVGRRSLAASICSEARSVKRKLSSFALAVITAGTLSACQTNPNELAMKIGAPPAGAVELRSLQSRRLDSTNSIAVLNAGTQTLQDLGFTIQESASPVGVLSASKQRDAEETGQVAGAIGISVLGALAGVAIEPVWDKDQTINVTMVETPVLASQQVDVRVSFDRAVRNTKNVYRSELILEPKIYQEFYEKLMKSLFLEKAP